jgi:hypothetical protein
MNIESVIRSVVRRTVIIINGEEFIVNESDLTELVREHHLLNDECFTNEEDVINFVGRN